MRRMAVVLLIAIVGLAGLWLAAGLVAKGMVSGAGSSGMIASLESSVGVPVSVGKADFDLAAWFLLHPAISLDQVTIGNPPGFRGRHLIEAQSLSAQVALLPLLSKTVEVHSINLDAPRILVETNAQGQTNIEAFLKKSQSKTAPAASRRESASSGAAGAGLVIDSLSITSGEIAAENLSMTGIDLHLNDFARDRACRLTFSARLFNGKASNLRLDAQAGPFGAESLPLNGKLSVTVAPDEM